MSLKYLENLMKSKDPKEWSPELLQNLAEEMRYFFETVRVKLTSGDPAMQKSASEEIRELRVFLEKHPMLLRLSQ
jgi:hypothetical protein